MRVVQRQPGLYIIEESDEEREERIETLEALAPNHFGLTEGQRMVLTAAKRAGRRDTPPAEDED